MNTLFNIIYLSFLFSTALFSSSKPELGVDRFFNEKIYRSIGTKRVGLVTNQTGRDSDLMLTLERFRRHKEIHIKAIFAPEHGLNGACYAAESVNNEKHKSGIPIYSLHGATRRPTDEMLKGIDLLIYDIQDIGSRSYTYTTTLFYIMEEAAKRGIEVIVLDRPNPMGGVIVDGPMLEVDFRSFIGYINVPYCHGMTIGELATYFNSEYGIGCKLQVIEMKGWSRSERFSDLDLSWIPTSPNIPEQDTPLYYASTGFLGELGIVSIGIGYTLPFKIAGAPWIDAEKFAVALNRAALPGIKFVPFYFRPFSGAYHGQDCQGVKLIIADKGDFSPVSVQYLLLTTIKELYPKEFEQKIATLAKSRKELFNKASGNAKVYNLLMSEKNGFEQMLLVGKETREKFLLVRERYLRY